MASMTGEYRATVISTADPDNLMRAKIRVNGLWESVPDSALPWAEYNLAVGGAFAPCAAGDLVWVTFPYNGDSRKPRITGMCMDASSGTPNVPAEASGQGDSYTQKTVDGAPSAPTLSATKDYVYKRNGLMEIRAAGGGWSMTHMESGTTMGLNDAGEFYLCVQGPIFLNATGNVTVKAAGSVDIEATSNVTVKAGGDMSLEAAGSLSIKAASVAVKKG
jgi:hypothetical protein